MKKVEYALIPCGSKIELCSFNGTFDEDEGMSMGEYIQWKNPNNAKIVKTVAALEDYDKDCYSIISRVLEENKEINRIYVCGCHNLYEGYYYKKCDSNDGNFSIEMEE